MGIDITRLLTETGFVNLNSVNTALTEDRNVFVSRYVVSKH